jgi:hypothetical protein
VCGVSSDELVSRHILDRLRLVLSHFACTAWWLREKRPRATRFKQCSERDRFRPRQQTCAPAATVRQLQGLWFCKSRVH